MLTIHHLETSQSERIVWLCEELSLPYRLDRHDRDPRTMAAPPAFKALHPLGAAPVITDGDVVLAESGAIVEYILARHGGGRLAVDPDDPDYPNYLHWLHFANGTLQPGTMATLLMKHGGVPEDGPFMQAVAERQDRAFAWLEERLTAAPYLAGGRLTAADIMTVFPLTTMRRFAPRDLSPYPAIRAYLRRIAGRPAYRAAMAKGDPGMAPLLD